MSFLSHLECAACGKKLEADLIRNLCPECGKPLLARYNLDEAADRTDREKIAVRKPDMWRYRELLPVRDRRFVLSLGEGFTPLLPAKRLGDSIGIKNLLIKEEGLNPTGSFKARGMSAAISRAFELGVKELSIPSAGNAAAAACAYAALAGMRSHVYMPADAPKSFATECKALGANVELVDGLIGDCGRIAAEGVKKFARFDMSTLKEPYRIEGKKTMGYELAEQMDWRLPDVIIYPTGGGTGLIGMWKAFDEMERLGWIEGERPRMVSVQSDGCAPIVKAFHNGDEFAETWPDAKTIADGIRVPAAIGDFLMLEALRESAGTAVAVSDGEIVDAMRAISRTEGIIACPEGASTFAALKRLNKNGWIRKDEITVLFNTGTGAKYTHLLE
ncbi:MAG: threonine synthase [Planctomycetota bacterium]|nr:MAG: threonine synthase [Planctomycetota bacterium]